MPQLEPLNLKLTGSADGLVAALGKGHNAISSFGGSIDGVAGRLAGFASMFNPATIVLGAVAAAAAAAYKAISEVGEAMQRVDDLTDAANRLGVTFGELKGIRLAIGEATGLEGEAVDAAIAKLEINLGEAARKGSGEAFEALQKLGLSAGQLLSSGPQQAIEMLADKISQVQNKSEQLQLAFAILGKSGLAIAAALRESPDGLKEAAEWAQKNISLTEEQVNQVGMANDAWDRMTLAVQAVFERVGSEIAPLFQLVTEDITALIGELGGADDATQGLVELATALYGIFRDIVEILGAPMRTALAFLDADLSRLGKIWSEAITFDGVSASFKRLDTIRAEAKKSKPEGISESQASLLERAGALDSQRLALEATQQAADSVRAKADEVRRSADAIKPKALAAVTDRADQLRRIGEMESKKSNDDLQKRLNDQVVGRLDRLIAAVNAPGPAPIDLD